uniref:RNase H type-1 domain-containing protein n=1 Tax=Davidia involucrata TaxID=16924 RepID=A0A5B7BB84_DAVIN
MMEAIALSESVQFCKDIGVRRIIVESDSRELILHLQYCSSFLAHLEVILHDVVLGERLRLCGLWRLDVGGNKVSHEVARAYCLLSDMEVWLDDPPRWLESFILEDKKGL